MSSSLPISKGEVERIGKRMVAGTATVDDLRAWNGCLIVYDRIRDSISRRLQRVDWHEVLDGRGSNLNVTSRVKTWGTTVDKLRRQPGSPLHRIQDIAGARIDGSMTLDGQDAVAAHVLDLYDGRLVDRRATPVRGYRALHVIVKEDGLLCEVQVRTELQHAWANLYERIGDTLGRDIRYADESTLPEEDDETTPTEETENARLIRTLGESSREIAELERLGNDWATGRVNEAGERVVDDEAGAVIGARAEKVLTQLRSATKVVEELRGP